MMSVQESSVVYEVQQTIEPIYTGGRCALLRSDGKQTVLLRAGSNFSLCDPQTGSVWARWMLVPLAPLVSLISS